MRSKPRLRARGKGLGRRWACRAKAERRNGRKGVRPEAISIDGSRGCGGGQAEGCRLVDGRVRSGSESGLIGEGSSCLRVRVVGRSRRRKGLRVEGKVLDGEQARLTSSARPGPASVADCSTTR